ncbi:MAG: two-component system response regulator [Candidatus Rokubacteria bacterium RIFCSPLOWO2_02_FULL_72_37]|nr:MAG: two-component system response regulator [Candidatus Rokubacteria bacterium RIFCSPLOWO2_02_FULL_72_37]
MKILVVDDEPAQRELVSGFLARHGFEVLSAGDGREALERFRAEPVDLILTDQKMPGFSGLQLLEAARAVTPEIAVIVMTAYGTIEHAVAAIKAGASDYLTKPLNLDELLHRIGQVRDRQRLVGENRELRAALQERHRVEGVIGESGRMQEALSLVRRVAASDATVLIRGESGTGKELIAKAIHYASRRAEGPLVRINCAALPEGLLESELFGHEKGAFTGAHAMRRGRFELAHGGSLFLDEIGDLPPHLQVKLLRVLQEREIERVGSSHPIQVDVRLLAATHCDLEALLKEGRFRDDLYYRLNVVTISVPPLRERREDIPLLLDHFLSRFARENGKTIRGLTREARETLLRYDYPGNVRELENVVERAVVLTRDEVIGLADLPLAVREPEPDTGEAAGLPAAVEGLERRMIREALARADGIQTRAAELLGISERVLRYKLRKYGLSGG